MKPCCIRFTSPDPKLPDVYIGSEGGFETDWMHAKVFPKLVEASRCKEPTPVGYTCRCVVYLDDLKRAP